MVQIITNSKLLRGGPRAAGNFYGVVDLFGFENQKCSAFVQKFWWKWKKSTILPAYGANGANKIDLTKWPSTSQPYAARFDSLIWQMPTFVFVVVKFTRPSSPNKTLSKSASLNCNWNRQQFLAQCKSFQPKLFYLLIPLSSIVAHGGGMPKSLGNIYSQDVPTVRPGTSLYDVL